MIFFFFFYFINSIEVFLGALGMFHKGTEDQFTRSAPINKSICSVNNSKTYKRQSIFYLIVSVPPSWSGPYGPHTFLQAQFECVTSSGRRRLGDFTTFCCCCHPRRLAHKVLLNKCCCKIESSKYQVMPLITNFELWLRNDTDGIIKHIDGIGCPDNNLIYYVSITLQ